MVAALAKEVVPVAHDVLGASQPGTKFFSETTYFGSLVKSRRIDLLFVKRFWL